MRTTLHVPLVMLLILSGCSRDSDLTGATDAGDGNGDPDGTVPRPRGSVVVNAGPTACELNSNCFDLTVTCPGVAVAAELSIRVGDPQGTARGTVLFASGGGGGGFWGKLETAQDVILELRSAGFRTAELSWGDRWFDGSSVDEGPAVLACRVATAADWVFNNLHNEPGFCAVGNSGGSAQFSYLLTNYGFDSQMDLLVPTEGPPFARIDLGCLPQPGDPPGMSYGVTSDRTGRFDSSFGFPDGAGPCSLSDESFRTRFEDASLAHGIRDFDHPATRVRFLFGENGNPNAQAQGSAYLDRLMESDVTDVSLTIVSGTNHTLHDTDAGAQAVRDVLLNECEPAP